MFLSKFAKPSNRVTKRKSDFDDSRSKERRHDVAKHDVSKGAPRDESKLNPVKHASKPPAPSEERKRLLRSRTELPIHPYASKIRISLLGNRHVLILVGETGSGKSTQVPQYLMTDMSESWSKGAIAVTQPRRVAATSLARRVADEVGTPLGTKSPASKVGYSVRFDPNFSPNTKIKYLTEGMLLQDMLRDPLLKQYGVVIVDEVHERSVNVDLILGFLKRILSIQVQENKPPERWRKGAGPLKVVVMSATADTEKLYKFFADGFQASFSNDDVNNQHLLTNGDVRSNKKTSTKVVNNDMETDGYSDSTWSGISSSEESSLSQTNPSGDPHQVVEGSFSEHISTIYIEGRQHPVETFYLPEPSQDYLQTALKKIFQIHYQEPLPGDILVFLTGQDTVESLEALVNEHASAMGPEVPSLTVLTLFAALPQTAQQQVFVPSPHRTRKVIIATNIAETSVTIPGITHVIDCGLHKSREFRPQLGLDTLLVKPISISSAIQRKGRAGREKPGKCYRLYTEDSLLALQDEQVPEILRCDLASSLLIMKARGVHNVADFPLLDPPARDAMRNALLSLHRLGAIDDSGSITQIGKKMARLPLPPHLSFVLIAASTPQYDCLLDAIDIVASLTVENIFLPLTSEEKREEAETTRRELFRRQGDHLTFLATAQAYAAENTDRKAWCEKHFVSHRGMRNVMDVRKQLYNQCQALGLLSPKNTDREDRKLGTDNDYQESHAALKPFLLAHTQNIALLHRDGSYKTVFGNQLVAIHPASVLFGRQRKAPAIVYSELVFTSRCWARNVSEIDLSWIDDLLHSVNGSSSVCASIKGYF